MFRIYTTDDGRELPFEYRPCSAMAPKYGMAMKMSGGLLAAATGNDVPTYICCREENAAVDQGTVIPVVAVQEDQIWTADGDDDMVIGVGYDIDDDSLSVAATSTGAACFVVTELCGGDIVRGRIGAAGVTGETGETGETGNT